MYAVRPVVQYTCVRVETSGKTGVLAPQWTDRVIIGVVIMLRSVDVGCASSFSRNAQVMAKKSKINLVHGGVGREVDNVFNT